MADDMADDLLAGLKANYYQRADGTIVRVYNAVLQYQGKPEVPLLYASIIIEMRPQTDISHGEVTIPLITSELMKYKRIPDAVVKNLRQNSSKLETSAQSQPSCTDRDKPAQARGKRSSDRSYSVRVKRKASKPTKAQILAAQLGLGGNREDYDTHA